MPQPQCNALGDPGRASGVGHPDWHRQEAEGEKRVDVDQCRARGFVFRFVSRVQISLKITLLKL